MRRLLTFMLPKIKYQASVPSRTSQKQDDDPICLQSGAKPFTFADFLSLQRSINQDSEEQRIHEEQRRRDERERDMKKFEILLGMHPT